MADDSIDDETLPLDSSFFPSRKAVREQQATAAFSLGGSGYTGVPSNPSFAPCRVSTAVSPEQHEQSD